MDVTIVKNNGPVEGVVGVCVEKDSESMDYWIETAHEDIMPNATQNVWKQIFSEWFPSGGYRYSGTPELEVYSDKDPSQS